MNISVDPFGGESAEQTGFLSVDEDVTEQGIDLLDAERKIIGTTHVAVEAYLMGLWGLPQAVIEVLAFHHIPSRVFPKALHHECLFPALQDVSQMPMTPLCQGLNPDWPLEMTQYDVPN